MKHDQPLLVALRLRPMNGAEFKAGAGLVAHTVDNNLVVLMDPNEDPDDILRANRSKEKKYMFDFAFDQLATQEDVYCQTTKNLIGDVLRGFNVTVFAYGPTGTGKTYTMLGTANDLGIMVLALNDLFTLIKANEDESIYRVTMSYLEIYNEMIRDLLSGKSGILDLREGATGESVVTGLREVETTSTTEVMKLLSEGNQRRTSEPTAANRTSSRSHAILKVTVEQRSRTMDVTQEVRTGRLFMVDLAGSERAAVTKNRGQRMVEGAHINRSLLALSNCINALVMGQGRDHYVNYRDSKLTRLLKESLGGNCRTVMIAHLSPASSSYEESRNTLLYAERSKHIKTRVQQNVHDVSYHVTQYHTLIAELKKKIAQLQERLAHCKCTPAAYDTAAVDDMCHRISELFAEQKEIREGLCSLHYQIVQNITETQKHLMTITEWQMKQHFSLPATTTTTTTATKDGESGEETKEEPHADTDISDEGREKEEGLKESGKLEQGTTDSALSITEITLTSSKVIEPDSIAQVRAEIATLVADKQRMEAHRRRLERRMKESGKQLEELQEELSKLVQLPHQQKGLQTMSEHHELFSNTLNYSLSAAVATIRVANQDSSIADLQQQCSSALDLLDKQWSLMKVHGVSTPSPLAEHWKELRVKQGLLELQVKSEKEIAEKIAADLPSTAHYSAKLNMTLVSGSKSNLLEESDTDKQSSNPTPSPSQQPPADSGIHLPRLPTNPHLVVDSWSSATMPTMAQLSSQNGLHVDTLPREPLSLPTLCSPTLTSEADCRHSETISRNYESLPIMQNNSVASKRKALSKPLLTFATPPITSMVQYPGHGRRGKKYMVPANHSTKDKPLDIESVKTSSVTSLATMKSSTTNTTSRKLTKRRKSYVAKRESRDPAMSQQPKLSQATRNRLKASRTVITSNDAAASRMSDSTQSTPYHARNPIYHNQMRGGDTRTRKPRNNNNNAIAKRKPFVVGGCGGGDVGRLQTKIGHSRANAGDDKFTSPYLSSVNSQHKRTSHPQLTTKLSRINRK